MPGARTSVGRKVYEEWSKGKDFPVVKATTNNPSGRNGKTITRLHGRDGPVPKRMTKCRFRSPK